MARRVCLLIAVLVLVAVTAPAATAAGAEPLRRIATLALGDSVTTDGHDLVVWQPTPTVLRLHALSTGIERDVAVPEPGCTLRSVAAGRAALECPDTGQYTGWTAPAALIVNLSTGASKRIVPPIKPSPIGGGYSLGARLGRYWLEGYSTIGDLHSVTTRFYVDLATSRVVWGHTDFYDSGDRPDDRVRDLDRPDLPVVACGPSWGISQADAPPYFARYGFDATSFWIDHCDGGRLARETRRRLPRLGSAGTRLTMSSRITVAFDDEGLVAYRTSDAARLAHWPFPNHTDQGHAGPVSAQAVGGRVVAWNYPGLARQAVYASGDVTLNAPPPRPPRLVLRPGVGIGDARLGLPRITRDDGVADNDFMAFLGIGRRAGGVRVYRSGVATLAVHFAAAKPSPGDGRATRISTGWPGTTVRGHRLGLGLKRLAQLLPRWRRPACHGRLLAHGDGPSTVLRRKAGGRVRATVQNGPPPPCARR